MSGDKRAEYDAIAQEYRDSKQLPFRSHVEEYTLFGLLGSLAGLAVLDLACGEGIYARKLKKIGAARVVGLDLSPAMVKLAEQTERQNPLGIEYRIGDARKLGDIGKFDIVMGAYLLNYAQTPQDLTAFCRQISANLKPGGRFVGINDNPMNRIDHFGSYRKYGFVKTTTAAHAEGDPVVYTMFNPDGTEFQFNNYYLSPETYERCFREAGLQDMTWHKPQVSPAGRKSFGPGFWDALLADPPLIAVSAYKGV